MYVIFAAAVFLTCSKQHVVDILAVASLSTCLGTAKTKYFNIAIYLHIIMPIPPRVVMTELYMMHR